MGTPVSGEDFRRLLDGFEASWFKMETQPAYAIGAERDMLDRFLSDGELPPPSAVGWWQDWLSFVSRHTAAGRVIQRVRVLDEPPTAYQRFLLAGSHWHEEAGEQVTYLRRGTAGRLGLLQGFDWSLFDNSTVVVARFTAAGQVAGHELITEPEAIAHYRAMRDVALRHSAPAAAIAAA